MYDPNAIKIYIDGSAMPNPGKGGLGLVVEFPDNLERPNFEISEGYFETTNNRMELLASIRAFEWLQNSSGFTRAIIVSDSEYVYSNHNNARFWKDDGWRDQYGKPYENQDLWDLFLRARQKLRLNAEIKWEKGKTREILVRVDALAKHGSKNPSKKDFGYQAGKFTATRTGNKKSVTLFPANNQEMAIRVYRKNVFGKNSAQEYKITFDEYSDVEEKFITKYFAYQGRECITLKRNNFYRVKFNGDPNYPVILEALPLMYPGHDKPRL